LYEGEFVVFIAASTTAVWYMNVNVFVCICERIYIIENTHIEQQHHPSLIHSLTHSFIHYLSPFKWHFHPHLHYGLCFRLKYKNTLFCVWFIREIFCCFFHFIRSSRCVVVIVYVSNSTFWCNLYYFLFFISFYEKVNCK
jgi:hypothetical protein